MVFDNVNTPEILNRYWPPCAHGSVLVTTQDRKVVHRAQADLHLKPLPADDGSRLILNYLPKGIVSPDEAVEVARRISEEVNGLPLLLVGLAGFMVDSHTTLFDTLKELKRPWDQEHHVLGELANDSATFQYGRPTQKAFDMSINRLPPTALSVLRVFSMLSADAISEDLIAGDFEDQLLHFGVSGSEAQ